MPSSGFETTQETIEAGLLHSCQTMAQWLDVATFTDEDWSTHKDIYRFVKTYLVQYGSLPSQSQISTRFTWNPPVGDFRYWLEEMKRYSLARRVLSVVQEGYGQIADPSRALNTLLEKLSLVRSEQTTHIQATDSSALERLAKFDTRTELIFNAREIIGVPTGMKVIDDTLIGWTPGSLVGVYARPGVGKTWLLCKQGVNAWMTGHTVLAIAPEMPSSQLNLRIDCLLGNVLGHPLDYGKIISGDPSIRTNYEIVTNLLSQSQRWWTYDSLNGKAINLADIGVLVRQHNPSIVLIDGISLIAPDSRNKQTWEQVRELCYGLKNLATASEVPIIMTHQAVNSARGHRTEVESVGRGDDFLMPSLNDAAYGDSFVQVCSDVITLTGDPSTRHLLWYSIRKSRERGFAQELPARLAMAVDYGKGIMTDLSELGYSRETVGMEIRRLFGQI